MKMKNLIDIKSSTFPKNQLNSKKSKIEENSKVSSPRKSEEKNQKEKEEPKKEEPKKVEEIKKEEKEKEKNENPNKSKEKAVDLLKNIFGATKNEATLKEIYKSIETGKNFEMSALKNPPKLEEESKDNIDLIPLKKQLVNYPLSAIGLLRCDYGNGIVMYGTGTLINLNMVITCAHVLYSPVLKRRCESAMFYLNLSKGKYLDSCKVETFVTPDEYEINQNEKYDYALCVLGEDIGKKGGFLGLCSYNEKEDKTGYIYGYSSKKSSNNFLSSFKTDINEYEILGVKSSLRYIEDDKILIYVGNKTKIGQDGSPIFKIIDDLEKEKNKIIENEKIKENEKNKEKEKNQENK